MSSELDRIRLSLAYEQPEPWEPRLRWHVVSQEAAMQVIPPILEMSAAESAIDNLLVDPYQITIEDEAAIGRFNGMAYIYGFAPAIELAVHQPPYAIPEFVAAYQQLKAERNGGKISADILPPLIPWRQQLPTVSD